MIRAIEVAADVFWMGGGLVNWYLLRDGQDLTLVDAGYPGDTDDVIETVASLGSRTGTLSAVLITHAHADHIGAIAQLQAAHGTPAYIGMADAQPARTGLLDQVTMRAVLAAAWRPRVALWAVAAVRRGGRHPDAAPGVRALTAAAGTELDLPGRPIPVPTPGHTPGHLAYYLPRAGAVITGDALVTGHATVRQPGPRSLPTMFDADPAQAQQSLLALSQLDANVILPGHGRPLHQPMAEAVEEALLADATGWSR